MFMMAQVNWMSMDQALEAQKKTPKKIMIKFYTDWCSMCKMMDKNTFSNPVITEYINDNYYAVKFNSELRYKKLEKARSPQGAQAVVCLQRKGNVYHGPATGSPRPDPWADMRRSITV